MSLITSEEDPTSRQGKEDRSNDFHRHHHESFTNKLNQVTEDTEYEVN
jgi:hypothetical protein